MFAITYVKNNRTLPSNDNRPQAIHITKLIPIDPVLSNKPDGETKIPDPVRKLKVTDLVSVTGAISLSTMKQFFAH